MKTKEQELRAALMEFVRVERSFGHNGQHKDEDCADCKRVRMGESALGHGFLSTGECTHPPNKVAADATMTTEVLLKWLEVEMLDDEGAMIFARDAGDWDRYKRLEGHRGGLLAVVHHLRAEQARLEADAQSNQD